VCRALKFLRDQAEAIISRPRKRVKGQSESHTTTSVFRRFLGGGKDTEEGQAELPIDSFNSLDPLDGWSDRDGVSSRKSHCCLLLKPQVILRDRTDGNDTCIVAAVQAKLQSFAIMDDTNVEDPITGKVMSR
jgi:hypothetical protein